MSQAVETPSGKAAGDENFPVGSWLLPARLRPHVAAFYRFARAIDDIADNPALAPADKIARLGRFADAIAGAETADPALETAHRLRASLAETGVTAQHCLDLIAAFKRDATKPRTDDWADLMDYCESSANPVGRYLLDLHGEAVSDYPGSDALCSALQVLNHLQDCQDDYRSLDRVYLPGDWLTAAGVSAAALDAARCGPGLRAVLDRCLDRVEDLLVEARRLPGRLRHPRLAMESAVILRLAERLTVLLRRGDPLARRVALGRLDFLLCGLGGAGGVLLQRALGGGRSRQAIRQEP